MGLLAAVVSPILHSLAPIVWAALLGALTAMPGVDLVAEQDEAVMFSPPARNSALPDWPCRAWTSRWPSSQNRGRGEHPLSRRAGAPNGFFSVRSSTWHSRWTRGLVADCTAARRRRSPTRRSVATATMSRGDAGRAGGRFVVLVGHSQDRRGGGQVEERSQICFRLHPFGPLIASK